jgi:hypothetical protein
MPRIALIIAPLQDYKINQEIGKLSRRFAPSQVLHFEINGGDFFLRMCDNPSMLSFLKDVAVADKFKNEAVWRGIVSAFLIKGHPQADKCCAWSSPIEGSTKRRFYAVLHISPIDSPEKAVRASIIHDHKVGKK